MAAITVQPSPHLRKVNVRQDLLAVADLIEICFSNTLDDDGRDYLRHMRWMAREANYLSLLQGAAERLSTSLYGFVWEEDGRIVGNLSLIPLYRRGTIFYLIANVAVHPEYRRRGIARQVTQAALDHLRERGIDSVWLQVRDDNPGAIHLYNSLGFVERARRTTWLASAAPPNPLRLPSEGLEIQSRRWEDWDRQSAWLSEAYPPEVSWNLPFNLSHLSPDLWNGLLRFLRGDSQRQWSARRGNQPVGFLAWEPSRTYSDLLWLAAPREEEDAVIRLLLPHAREELAERRRPLSLNYPAGRGAEAFLRADFSHHQTLIWMSANLKSHQEFR